MLFKGPKGNESAAQIEAFNDTWHWTDAAEEAFQDVRRSGNAAATEMLTAMRSFLGENDMMAYLSMMVVRLIELHRVLKPTGSLYLHCDPTASHYLKILLDAVFGKTSFQNEIIWRHLTMSKFCQIFHSFGIFNLRLDLTWVAQRPVLNNETNDLRLILRVFFGLCSCGFPEPVDTAQ